MRRGGREGRNLIFLLVSNSMKSNVINYDNGYFISPQRARVARVTAVVMCMCVHSYLLPHKREIPTGS